MSGLRVGYPSGTPSADDGDTKDTYIFDPKSLSSAQVLGDACATCHTKWPRPRRPLGTLPDGARVYGCDECANIIVTRTAPSGGFSLAMR